MRTGAVNCEVLCDIEVGAGEDNCLSAKASRELNCIPGAGDGHGITQRSRSMIIRGGDLSMAAFKLKPQIQIPTATDRILIGMKGEK